MTAQQTDPPVAPPASVRDGVDIPHDCEPTVDVSATAAVDTPAGSSGAAARRVIGVDVARGLALIGMMAVHILPEVNAQGQMSDAWIVSVGKAAALFAVLAGVGIAFGSGGRRRPTGRKWTAASVSLVVRALMIGAVGLLLGHVVSPDSAHVILAYYAVLFVLAIPLLSLSTRALVVLAAAVTLFMPVLSHLVRAQLPVAPDSNPSFTDLVTEPTRVVTELALTGVFPALPWLAYLCVGVAVGRSALDARGVVIKIGVIGVAIAFAASAGSWLVMNVAGGWRHLESVAMTTMDPEEYTDLIVWGFSGVTPTSTPWWLGIMAPHSSTTFDIAFTIGTSLAVLSACLLLGRVASSVLVPLAAAGSMTFTLYTAHLLMLGAPFQPDSEATTFVIQLVVVVGFALLWRRWFSRGPLEAAVWWVTRKVRQSVMGTTGGGAAKPVVDAHHHAHDPRTAANSG